MGLVGKSAPRAPNGTSEAPKKAANDRRLHYARLAIADYEAEFGVITEEEMDEQERADRQSAAEVRARSTAQQAGNAA